LAAKNRSPSGVSLLPPLKLRLDSEFCDSNFMKSTSPSKVWIAMALKALTAIAYVATPPW
jgi:hypothetical protein